MSFVTANDVRFHVQVLGNGPGPLVVMLHGLLFGNLASWYFTTAPTLAHDHQVLLYDLRGHGRSQRVPRGYGVASMTRDLEALLVDRAGKLVLVGHSHGASVAMRFTIDHPERVERLVVVEAPSPPYRTLELEQFHSSSPEHILKAMPVAVQRMLEGADRRADKFLRSIAFLLHETSLMNELADEPEFTDTELRAISCPVLCMYGTTSSCAPMGVRLVRSLPRAQLTMLDGGHYLHLDRPTELTRSVTEFVHA